MPKSLDTPSDSASIFAGTKRSPKACNRCRLKKVKCDGQKPCSRCVKDDLVCCFITTQRADLKPISAARAHQLQLQQEILVRALRILWNMESPLLVDISVACGENPSTHAIVEALGLLDENLDPMLKQYGIDFDEPSSAGATPNDSAITHIIGVEHDASASNNNLFTDPKLGDCLNDSQEHEADIGFDVSPIISDIPNNYGLADFPFVQNSNVTNYSQPPISTGSNMLERRRAAEVLSLGALPNCSLSLSQLHPTNSYLGSSFFDPTETERLQ